MIKATVEAAIENWGETDWAEDYQMDRERLLAHFSYSVVVEGGYEEDDNLKEWMQENFCDASKGVWDSLWYGKCDYNYGYWEYFFSSEADLQRFIQKLPSIYGSYGSKRLRTEGSDNYIELGDA